MIERFCIQNSGISTESVVCLKKHDAQWNERTSFCAHYRGVPATRSGGQSSSACSPYGHFWTAASRCFLSSQLHQLELTVSWNVVFLWTQNHVTHSCEMNLVKQALQKSRGGLKNIPIGVQCEPRAHICPISTQWFAFSRDHTQALCKRTNRHIKILSPSFLMWKSVLFNGQNNKKAI